jgi:hypothetical protein
MEALEYIGSDLPFQSPTSEASEAWMAVHAYRFRLTYRQRGYTKDGPMAVNTNATTARVLLVILTLALLAFTAWPQATKPDNNEQRDLWK